MRPSLQKMFKPAFLGRLTIVPFLPISDEVLRKIITLKLSKVNKRIAVNHDCEVVFPEELVEYLASRCNDVDSGARDAEALITRTVLAKISKALLDRQSESKAFKKITATVKDGDVKIKIT